MIDAVEGLTDQDKKIAAFAVEEGRGVILALNKWDTMPDLKNSFEAARDKLRFFFGQMAWAPVIPISAKKGEGMDKLVSTIITLHAQLNKRIETAKLNKAIEAWVEAHAPARGAAHPLQAALCGADFGKSAKVRHIRLASRRRHRSIRILPEKQDPRRARDGHDTADSRGKSLARPHRQARAHPGRENERGGQAAGPRAARRNEQEGEAGIGGASRVIGPIKPDREEGRRREKEISGEKRKRGQEGFGRSERGNRQKVRPIRGRPEGRCREEGRRCRGWRREKHGRQGPSLFL
jgi:hypothetical protein